jgi:hypothetical protein
MWILYCFLSLSFIEQLLPSIISDVDVETIPDILGVVNLNGTSIQLIDTIKARNCLTSKYIAILGDSTLSEVTHDLAILLSGMAKTPQELDKYLYRATRLSPTDSAPTFLDLPLNVSAKFYTNHRNFTIACEPLNIYVRHRFTGHWALNLNMLGISTFNSTEFADELGCILGRNNRSFGSDTCRRNPDVIVLNSGLHDIGHHVTDESFCTQLHNLIQIFKLSNPRSKLIWKSNFIVGKSHPRIRELNALAWNVTKENGVPFVNSTYAYEIVASQVPNVNSHNPPFTDPSTNHVGAIGRYFDSRHKMTLSSLGTQLLLNEICFN